MRPINAVKRKQALYRLHASTPCAAAVPAAPGVACALGRIVELDVEGRLAVELCGQSGRQEALLAAPIDREAILALIKNGRKVVLAECGDPRRLLLIGVVTPPEALREQPTEVREEPGQPRGTLPPFLVRADVDGRRVELKAQDELVLRCGDASVTLRRNGRVIIRGAHVETYSTGVNRIKGGQVKIN